MLEQNIQSKIIKYLESIGCFVIKSMVLSKSGIPDILGVFEGTAFAFEIKRKTPFAGQLQMYKLQKFIKAGGKGYIVTSLDEVKQIIDKGFSFCDSAEKTTKTIDYIY